MAALQPVGEQGRIALLDGLRGFALFGILPVNMAIFGSPALVSTSGLISAGPLDVLLDQLVTFFAIGRFYSVFRSCSASDSRLPRAARDHAGYAAAVPKGLTVPAVRCDNRPPVAAVAGFSGQSAAAVAPNAGVGAGWRRAGAVFHSSVPLSGMSGHSQDDPSAGARRSMPSPGHLGIEMTRRGLDLRSA